MTIQAKTEQEFLIHCNAHSVKLHSGGSSRPRFIEYHDQGPDALGRRHFSLQWWDADRGVRGQHFHSQPEKYVTMAGPRPVTETDLQEWIGLRFAANEAEHKADGFKFDCETLGYTLGKKYARIIAEREPGSKSGSAYCFVNLQNGDILKTKSWASPAKGARGNIFAADRLAGTTKYGAAYR